MERRFILGSVKKLYQKQQVMLSTWMFRTLIWWGVAWMVPKVGFDMIWFATLPAGLSLFIWPVGQSIQKANLLRWAGLGTLSMVVFVGQNWMVGQELSLFFLIFGSLVTAGLVAILSTYFST
jgi:hypothetical protein